MIYIIVILGIIFTTILYKRSKSLSDALLPLILINLVFTIALGVNAVAPQFDGISINNALAALFFDDDGKDWSRIVFLYRFKICLYVNLILIFIYSILKLFPNRNRK
ncbi:hypothetical protein HZI73_00045 [Vallitalea pronyensis]|uniref:Uncharacterized protein n=1 Tax=Vallitalea pronyensis TaxID=1348613 RepID=A0A8J8MFW1_9FIRM|nr:hypothetical protein [Vallitalea pronyensis]QUI20796.1 hypothetical protein HZI73_00045 [Vallitalea pronyensis]